MTRNRGLVHFWGKSSALSSRHQKWTRSLFRSRSGFTLFELILAIALSAVLLTLIGTAINLYLTRVDAGRSRVEEAQLARSILAMIADDIRATTVYQPQDTSAIAQLMAKSSTFDVDSIDKPRESTSGSGGSSGGSSSGSSFGSSSGSSGASSASGAMSSLASGSSSASSQMSSGSSSNDQSESDNTLPLGLNGKLDDLFVDATRLPRQDELFAAATGYSNAQSPVSGATSNQSQAAAAAGIAPPSDVKTVHYFVRAGAAVESGSAGATSLDPAAQQQGGGLVRQEVSRSPRVFAEQNGNSEVTESGAALIAPEVMHIEFRYFYAGEVVDVWDMKERKCLPTAVEVAIWLRTGNSADQPITTNYDATTLANSAREYRQVVYLPMAAVMNSGQSGGSSGSSTSSSSDTSSSTSSSSSSSTSAAGSGSSFSQ